MTEEPTGTRLAVLLGNTTCRFGLMEGLEVRRGLVLTHAQLLESGAAQRLRELCEGQLIEETGLCSVVPSLEAAVAVLLQAAGLAPFRRVEPAESTFFPTRYRSMDTLGADRYCGVLAARERYGAPVIVADCGTATTVNVVDAEGFFLGGAIAPGVETALQVLHDRTAQLPQVDISQSAEGIASLIGNDTAGCMRAGAVDFTRYALEGMVGEIKKLTGDNTPFILTGGNAPVLLAAGLSISPQVYEQELLFGGLIFYLLFTR
ncbi:MAG: type III pantothenate kinase [Bacteroidota bacterium]|jgi:type III pantothenate kinase